jgi:flavin-dependent dehydrogenase
VRFDYDVVVAGARVAGAMTALHLAREGHRVLIVDRAGPPADTISTHALMRTAVLQLARAGLLDAITGAHTPPVNRMTLGFGDKIVSFDVRADFGVTSLYAPRRTVLDPVILDAAVAAGAELELGSPLTGLLRDERGRVTGASIGRSAATRAVRSRYVIGADGRNSTVADLVGASESHVVAPTAATAYGYFAGMADSGFDFRFVPGVTVGSIRTSDDLTLLWVGVPAEQFDTPHETFWSALGHAAPDIAEAAMAAERVERMRFTSGFPTFLRRPAGPGWVLVGDAGATADPLSAHGISSALRDAEFAAEAVMAGLESPEIEAAAGVRFRYLRDRFAIPGHEASSALASYQWTVEEASSLMRTLGRVTDAECDYLTRERPVARRVA